MYYICTPNKMSLIIIWVTCVWPTFSSGDDKTKGTVWGPDELQQKSSIRENLCDSAHRAHQSGGQYILYTQGPVKVQLGTVWAATAGKHTPPGPALLVSRQEARSSVFLT